MNKSRINISVALMLLAILAVAAFQVYWLRKGYREAEQTLQFRAHALFRDVVYSLQGERMQQDSGIQIQVPEGTSSEVLARSLQGYIADSLLQSRNRSQRLMPEVGSQQAVRLAEPGLSPDDRPASYEKAMPYPGEYSTPATTDSFTRSGWKPAPQNRNLKTFFRDELPGETVGMTARTRSGPAGPMREPVLLEVAPRVMVMARGMPAMRDSLSIATLTGRTDTAFQQEGISVSFTISAEKNMPAPTFPVRSVEQSNTVWPGFGSPFLYQIELFNTMPYLLRQLTPQLIVSVLLVGLTVLSFVLLLRNLMQQRRLTQLKNDLISNITHELKTPIATVSVAIEALKNFNALHDPARTREYLDISGSELQRLSLLVDKVLRLSMFEKQQIDLREERFDLKQVVEEVIASMRLQFEKYQAAVSLQAQGEDFTMQADRLHITSVVFNLLDNALKYSNGRPSVEVGLTATGSGIELSVRDNGIGIAPEYRKKIFEKFFRIPTGDTHNVKGYGLGLSYVAYVVQRHRGRVLVESEAGSGSRFIIKFPRPA